MTKLGRFIVVEGLEGAGKSTAIAYIKHWLAQRAIVPVCTREPGGTPMAEALRDLVKQVRHAEQVAPETELLLMYAARMQLVLNVIRLCSSIHPLQRFDQKYQNLKPTIFLLFDG